LENWKIEKLILGVILQIGVIYDKNELIYSILKTILRFFEDIGEYTQQDFFEYETTTIQSKPPHI
jgi:hypothetical protein